MMHGTGIQPCSTDPRASLQGCIRQGGIQIWNHYHLKQIYCLLLQYTDPALGKEIFFPYPP